MAERRSAADTDGETKARDADDGCGIARSGLHGRVARWFIFKPKIPIWVYFVGPWDVKCW
jgi:hypothetical protein